jgi:hypothetical protein
LKKRHRLRAAILLQSHWSEAFAKDADLRVEAEGETVLSAIASLLIVVAAE